MDLFTQLNIKQLSHLNSFLNLTNYLSKGKDRIALNCTEFTIHLNRLKLNFVEIQLNSNRSNQFLALICHVSITRKRTCDPISRSWVNQRGGRVDPWVGGVWGCVEFFRDTRVSPIHRQEFNQTVAMDDGPMAGGTWRRWLGSRASLPSRNDFIAS